MNFFIKEKKHIFGLFPSSTLGWKTALFFLAILGISDFALAENKAKPQYIREKCLKGITIYCLAAGMEEQKVGELEQALEYFRLACESHPAMGHFKACTPYLSLAMELGRLDSAAMGFNSRCKDGDNKTCFYLAKEFLKITAYEKAHILLERLCSERFRPPDSEDYGPCYHLGVSYLKTRNSGRAKEIFRFDCRASGEHRSPSCIRYDELVHDRMGLPTRAWNRSENFLTLIIVTPAFQWALFCFSLPLGRSLVLFGGPLLTLVGFVALGLSEDGFHQGQEWYFILPSFLLTLWISWLTIGKSESSKL